MLYNAQRQRVTQWSPDQGASTCPDCQRPLLPRRGDIVIWHWAHYPDRSNSRPGCYHEETAWHLAWKTAYDQLPDWQVEARIEGFRADAVNFHTGAVREFIHSLSPYYAAKHKVFAALRYDVRWIFDGNVFSSQRQREVKNGGIKGLLRPRAYALHLALAGRCWVHWDGQLWKEWKQNVWYPRQDAQRLLTAFNHSVKELTPVVSEAPKPTTRWSPHPNPIDDEDWPPHSFTAHWQNADRDYGVDDEDADPCEHDWEQDKYGYRCASCGMFRSFDCDLGFNDDDVECPEEEEL